VALDLDAEVPVSEIAVACNKPDSTVDEWTRTGGLKSRKRGRHRVVRWRDLLVFLAHLKPTEPGSFRNRLAKEQAEKIGLENARRRGELLLASDVADVLSTLAADLNARHDGLPGREAAILAGIGDAAVIRDRLRDELRTIRSGFAAAIDQLADSLGAAQDDGGDPDAAPEANERRVGRREPRAAKRQRRARAVAK